MGNHTKENKEKKKQREKLQFWSVKASFVAGFIVIITIFKELYEYFRSELPLYVNGIYVLLCLIVMLGILGTEKFDKYLNSKGVENFGTSLTVGSILIFALENSIFKIKMDAIEAIEIWLILATIVIGALYLLFCKYEKQWKNTIFLPVVSGLSEESVQIR